MERHLEKDAKRPSRKSKKEVAKPLETAALDLVTGDQSPVVSGADDINPGEKKRLWAVFPVKVPRKRADTPVVVAPQTQKKSAPKSGARPAAQKAKRGPERSLS